VSDNATARQNFLVVEKEVFFIKKQLLLACLLRHGVAKIQTTAVSAYVEFD
jgi:hypothetical protein